MSDIELTVFTKPWTDPIEVLAEKVASLGLSGIELPIRPGYQVQPDNVKHALPQVVGVLERSGLKVRSAAAPLEPDIIAACGDAGIPIVRTMVGIDLSKAGYAETIAQHRKLWDRLIPTLDKSGVSIGVQNHSGSNIGSAIGLYHVMEKYDPRHVCAVLDMAHSAIAGEPADIAVDLLWPRLRGLVNFKAAFRERINGPEEAEAEYRTHWTTAAHSGYSWRGLVEELGKRRFTGVFCLPAEYSDPGDAPQRMGDDVLPYLRQDIAYLKSLLPGEPP
jgi:sugar phosphate isomerase/epimerase